MTTAIEIQEPEIRQDLRAELSVTELAAEPQLRPSSTSRVLFSPRLCQPSDFSLS